MVTICTTSLTFNNSTFSPHTVFMCFVWISEQTAIISLYSINWLVCVTETECVYCAVRTGCLYIIQVKFSPQNVNRSLHQTCCLSCVRACMWTNQSATCRHDPDRDGKLCSFRLMTCLVTSADVRHNRKFAVKLTGTCVQLLLADAPRFEECLAAHKQRWHENPWVLSDCAELCGQAGGEINGGIPAGQLQQ